jgi:hypothetical protein
MYFVQYLKTSCYLTLYLASRAAGTPNTWDVSKASVMSVPCVRLHPKKIAQMPKKGFISSIQRILNLQRTKLNVGAKKVVYEGNISYSYVKIHKDYEEIFFGDMDAFLIQSSPPG